MTEKSNRFVLTHAEEGGFVAFDPITKSVTQGETKDEAISNLIEAVGLYLDEITVTRTATCRRGQLSVACRGEPVRVSVCHCYDCQKRSGSAFAAQARFPADAVTINGEHKVYEHIGDSGNSGSFHFCPICASTLWYHARPNHDLFAIPTGAFADRDFPAPHYSVWEERKHPWVTIDGDGIEHHD